MTFPLNFVIDRESEEPIYRQLIRQIKLQIESGQLPSGTRLPASRDLADQMAISRISVVNAYAELRAEGYLSAHAGRGTFIARDSASLGAAGATTARSDGGLPSPLGEDKADTLPDYSLRDMMRLARRPGIINFSYGAPPTEFFPVSALRDALNAVLDRDGAEALSYEMSEGYMPLRVAVREYVSALGIRCSADNILITGGAQQAIDLVVQALMSEGETLVTSMPTYLGVLDIARARRVQIHSVPQDEYGLRVDHLENYLLDNHAPRLIYVMPTFQNPTGNVMSMHRRRQLINLAHEHRIPIVEDAVYHEFRFEGEALPPLKALDESGTVIHISAFTKMLLPGVRIGYLISNSQHYERLVRVKQAADISTSGLNQRAVHYLLTRGILAQQLERNNRELRRRRDAALRAAEQYFPKDAEWCKPEGGLYLWVRLPRTGPTAAELFITALQKNVSFAIGNIFFTNGGGQYHMRLNYGQQRPDLIDEGFKRIGQAWQEMAQHYGAAMEKSPML
jgi:DNA-binding transcriptional MocR family regulator